MSEALDAGRRVLRRAKYFMGDRPALMPIFLRLTPEGVSRAIDDSTDLVLEGFPRSGNTFAVFAFRQANPSAKVASHVHHLAPMHIARTRGLPLLVVGREPVSCLSSYLIAGPHGRPAGVLDEYISYFEGLQPFAESGVFATFDQVTSDFGVVIDRLNARFDTAFSRFSHHEADTAKVFASIEEYHAQIHRRRQAAEVAPVPHTERRERNASHRTALEQPELADSLSRARELFGWFEDLARR